MFRTNQKLLFLLAGLFLTTGLLILTSCTKKTPVVSDNGNNNSNVTNNNQNNGNGENNQQNNNENLKTDRKCNNNSAQYKDWKKLINDEYKFEFCFPENFVLVKNEKDEDGDLDIYFHEDTDTQLRGRLFFRVSDENLAWWEEPNREAPFELIEKKEIKYENFVATRYSHELLCFADMVDCEDDMTGSYIFKVGNRYYEFSIVYKETKQKEAYSLMDKILNTLNFELSNWKIYSNEALNFQIKIPNHVTIEAEFNDENNRLVRFRDSEEYFEVELKDGNSTISLKEGPLPTPLDEYSYLDNPISRKSVLGGQEAVVFEAPNGYCDAVGCGSPFITYATKHNGDFYNLTFSGDIKLSDTEQEILDSFKFIK